ncbi:Glycoside hydrolase [Parasponia andersonii]|uniref:alpha-amylase n=1 Tax=Parasponia andersonii TaxID=3476 RepID=A0A2P5CVN8_PARAD|nr:Glycoside hydrolase [Parasponia andersonii]
MTLGLKSFGLFRKIKSCLVMYIYHKIANMFLFSLFIFLVQFYDHLFIIKRELMEPIREVTAIRKRNGINSRSTVNILAAEANLYMARIDDKLIIKIGSKGDLGNILPPDYKLAYSGEDFAVWEKK